ncbi:hypothetical protein [Nitrosospira briensis]|nr:hypothetical protein [Nitrosospira briensis]
MDEAKLLKLPLIRLVAQLAQRPMSTLSSLGETCMDKRFAEDAH